MSNAISIRVQPLTTAKSIGQAKHDLRMGGGPGYVDDERTPDNSVVIAPPDMEALAREIADGRKAAGQQKLRKDASITVAGIITFGREAQDKINQLAKADQDALFLRVAQALSQETGHALIGLVVHRDEHAPHAHFFLRGYRQEAGKELPARFSRSDLKRLQDVAAKEVEHLGIERGTSKVERLQRGDDLSQVIHRSVKELHQDLPAEIEKLKQELAAQTEKLEKNQRLCAKAERDFLTHADNAEKIQKRAEAYERRATEAQQQIERLNAELEAAQRALQTQIEISERKRKEAEEELERTLRKGEELLRSEHFFMPKYPEKKEVIVKTGIFSTEKTQIIEPEQFYKFADEAHKVYRSAGSKIMEKNQIIEKLELENEKLKAEIRQIYYDPEIKPILQRRYDEQQARQQQAWQRQAVQQQAVQQQAVQQQTEQTQPSFSFFRPR